MKVGSLNILENHIFYAGLQHKTQREKDLEFQIKTEADFVFNVLFLLFHWDQMVILYCTLLEQQSVNTTANMYVGQASVRLHFK